VQDLIEALDDSLAISAVMRLIFIDTTVFCIGESDENHPSTVTRAYNAADEIIAHFDGACSVIFILHTGKNQSRGVRGSSNWEKSAGFRLEFSTRGSIKEQEESRLITYPEFAVVSSKKNKDGPFQQSIHYQVSRDIFEAYETDPNFKEPRVVKDSVLHLSVVPESGSARVRVKKGDKSPKLKSNSPRDIIATLVNDTPAGKWINMRTLATLAEEKNLLEGKPRTRQANFIRKVHRYMQENATELDSKWYFVHNGKGGMRHYRFIGQGKKPMDQASIN
jgi:hypothetical protein